MKLEFIGIKDKDFLELVQKAKELAKYQVLNSYKRKELISFAYTKNKDLSNDETKFIYALESPVNVKEILCAENFNPENFVMNMPTTLLKTTDKGAVITIDERKIFEGGGTGKFLCDHTARIINAYKESGKYNLQLTGFIHIPEFPDFEQLSEVLSIGIASIYKKYPAKNLKIMLTGFTKFRKVENNATSEFLFGDGVNNDFSSFAFKNQTEDAKERINKMIFSIFGELNYDDIVRENIIIGRKYYLEESNSIEILLVRLPVDTEIKRKNYNKKEISYSEFMTDLADNSFGDRCQHILEYTISNLQPDVIISLGVHTHLPKNIYEIETEIYGLDPKYSKGIRPKYPFYMGKGTNRDLADIYNLSLT